MAGRLTLAALATLSVACNYATRSLLPIAAHAICDGSRCSASDLVSEATSAFFLGDLVAQFTAGLALRLVAGPWLLALSSIGWTLATMLVPLSLGPTAPQRAHAALQMLRGALCGMGFPAAHAVVAATPADVRATALGLINASAGIGTALANAAVPRLLRHFTWEVPFTLQGVGTLLVSASLAAVCVSRKLTVLVGTISLTAAPRGAAAANSSGRTSSTSRTSTSRTSSSLTSDYARWLEQPLVRGLVVWMVVVAVAVQTVGGAFLPTLFIEVHGVPVGQLGGYTAAPPLAQVAVSLCVGVLADSLVRYMGLPAPTVRAYLQLIATVGPIVSLALLSQLSHAPRLAALLVTLWLGTTSFHCAGAIAMMHAVGGARGGELFVLGNAFAKLGALLSTSMVRWAIGAFGWPVVLLGVAGGYVVSGALLLPLMFRAGAAGESVVTDAGKKAT